MLKDDKLEERQASYRKCKFGLLELREKSNLSLRKEKLEEMILKKRIKQAESKAKYGVNPFSLQLPDVLATSLFTIGLDKMKSDLNLIITLLSFINLSDSEIESKIDSIKFGVILLREHFSGKKETVNLSEMKNRGVFQLILAVFHKFWNDLDVIYELYSVLGNISYYGGYSEIQVLMDENFMKYHYGILESNSDLEVADLIIFFLTNVISENLDFRNYLFGAKNEKLIEIIIELTGSAVKNMNIPFLTTSLSFFHQYIKLCSPKVSADSVANIEKIFNIFSDIIDIPNNDIFSICIWGLSIISEFDEKLISLPEIFNQANIVSKIFSVDYSKCPTEIIPCIRIIGNLLSSDENKHDDVIMCILDAGVLDFCNKILLTEKTKRIKRETLWAIGNITGGSYKHLKEVAESDVFYRLIDCCKDTDYTVRKESVWVLANMCTRTTFSLSTELLKRGLMDAFNGLLDGDNYFLEPEIIELVIVSLHEIFKSGACLVKVNGSNPFVKKFDLIGGREKIEKLLSHPNHKVYKCAECLMEKFMKEENVYECQIKLVDEHRMDIII